MTTPTWIPVNNFPGDQTYDIVPGTPDKSFWGQVGPETTGWSWDIQSVDNAGTQCTVDSGVTASEVEAKAIVESWRPDATNVSSLGEP